MKGRWALLAAVIACQDASSPVDPVWGKQACASCTMLVSERRFAAELVTADGTRVFFDDPGCMATWLVDGNEPRTMWVRLHGGWVGARGARFARGQASPMGFDFAADENGDATWADVERAARERKGEPR